jgi:hypothetical protein
MMAIRSSAVARLSLDFIAMFEAYAVSGATSAPSIVRLEHQRGPGAISANGARHLVANGARFEISDWKVGELLGCHE